MRIPIHTPGLWRRESRADHILPRPYQADQTSFLAQDEGTYEVTCNDNLLVIVQIESQSGHDNVEEIAAVPGVGTLPFH